MGEFTISVRPVIPTGNPNLTGRLKTCSAISIMPSRLAEPPVRTTPDAATSSNPAFIISLFTRVMISSTRGSTISARICRDTVLGLRPPTLGTSIISSRLTMDAKAHPYFFFIFSASVTGVLRPMAISLVRWFPPRAMTAVCLMLPSANTAISVVPPPMSTRTTPSSFSSLLSTASLEASCWRTMSLTSRPVLLQHLTMF